MAENAADRAAFLNADDFGEAATYTPAGGAAASIVVLLDKPHSDATLAALGISQVGYQARIRVDDITLPADGDALVVGSDNFTVRKVEQDLSGTFWTLELEIVA